MEDLSMFQRPRTVALEYEKPGTHGTVLIYPLDRLVEFGFMGNIAVNPWVDIVCRRQAFARESESLMRPRTVALEYEKPGTYGTVLIYPLNRLVECGFVDYMPTSILGISGVHGDTHDILIHGLTPIL
ncbi:hypothetical protein PIB30_036785 [Stylosanthes scabra]|uniref:Uncharacterized protein n=1 Tax=Stylosanthes scabra TaxID=79078 RepID=A0ABU6XCN4_9FABA|nr:hypothetical protein [Stylosanthes scabra]